jgi:UDP-N-acetyl-D-mannosaminuronic acid transferase (WecB/TagA/CpsF family)
MARFNWYKTVIEIEKVNRPGFTIAHWLTTISLAIGLLAAANSTENKVVEQGVKQQGIEKTQQEIRKEFKEFQAEQRKAQQEQTRLLYQIKGSLEK